MPAATLPDALAAFDILPDSAFIRVQTVARLLDCAVPTVWRRSAAGLLPPPYRFGHSTRWKVGEIRHVLATGSGGSGSTS
jgi:predicted DNA-binding transcriptional regulator AlpA